jgi:hypothetical protein
VSCSACVPSADAGLPDAAPKDARPDEARDATGGADARPCALDARITCAQGSRQGDVGICADVADYGICVDGAWVCPAGSIDTGYCTCDGAPAPGCTTCTPHGYVCADAGTDAIIEADAATCVSGCAPASTSAGSLCSTGETQWSCQGTFDASAFAACRDPGTNLQRYCCPPSFMETCHGG